MQNIPVIKGAGPVLARLNELSERAPSAFQGSEKPAFDSDIRFEEVDFGYTGEHQVLDGLDVRLEKGKKYVLAGGSGCGKSTIIRLLCAEHSGYTGAIRLDGKELHDLDIDQLLTHISVIHQGVYMFDETIRDNISLHRAYSADEWERALRLSGVDKFLPRMDFGLDTPVGEGGANLSGGQRQRIAVARALIEGKPILVLDEGTSAVDPQTAYDIESALVDLGELTMITITHNLRPEMLRRYDKVLYMENGCIAEAGDFDTLIEKGGAFASFQRIVD
jgi:ABC-type multidrug transport system fused ATPase/permease subunit